MKSIHLLGALAVLAVTGAARAATPIQTTVSANGAYEGNIANLNDGIFPPNGSAYSHLTVHSFATNTLFTFAFNGLQTITGFKFNADHNDNYTITLHNGNSTLTRTVLSSQGAMNQGTETFTSSPMFGGTYLSTLAFPEFAATHATIRATGGDGFYAIGEVQFFTDPVAVPEPATWAMLMLGFGALGLSMRRTKATRVRYPSIAQI